MLEKIFSKNSHHIYIYEEIKYSTVKDVSIALDKIKENIINSNSDKKFKLRKNPIVFHIHSPGGSLEAGLQLYNIIQTLNSEYPTYSINEGLCASAATLPFISCKTRVVSPFSVFLIHQYSTIMTGKHSNLEENVKFGTEIMSLLRGLYKKHTNCSVSELTRLLNRDKYLSAHYMKKIGMADVILDVPPKNKTKMNSVNNNKFENSIFMDRFVSIPNKITDDLDKFSMVLPFVKVLHFISFHKNEVAPCRVYLENITDKIINFINFLPLLNALLYQKNKIEVLSNGYLEDYMALLFVISPNPVFNKNEIIKINLKDIADKSKKTDFTDIKENTKLMREIITTLLKKRTSMKEAEIKKLFDKTFIFSSKMAKSNKLI